MRITSKGQVTIPVEIREKLGLVPNSEVESQIVGQAVRICRVRKKPGSWRIARVSHRPTGRRQSHGAAAGGSPDGSDEEMES